ncbi:MAG TPA: Holliday junction resolvase-like protein [Anaerolineae bacterium]|nr:Holliday junction resolvase-like protein [Anaerolineae bacterium]HQI83535.1 Holliday junction resolvase-like protein [Anaerolineae bacterium]
MEILYLLVGLVIGVALAYWLLRVREQGQRGDLRDEIAATYRARTEAERARLAQQYEARIHELEEQHAETVVSARRQSAEQSRAVLKGKMAEQMAPLLPGFAYWPADARFLGDPVDYVVFDGYSALKDEGADGDVEIVILDIKQGKSVLTEGQRRIAKAVEAGRVRFEVVRVFADGTARSYTWGKSRP